MRSPTLRDGGRRRLLAALGRGHGATGAGDGTGRSEGLLSCRSHGTRIRRRALGLGGRRPNAAPGLVGLQQQHRDVAAEVGETRLTHECDHGQLVFTGGHGVEVKGDEIVQLFQCDPTALLRRMKRVWGGVGLGWG